MDNSASLLPGRETIQRVAMLSVHTCPLALLGGKKTGGMNVYVRDAARELGRQGVQVDVFTRSQDDCQPRIKHDLGNGGRVIHIPAGPENPSPLPTSAATWTNSPRGRAVRPGRREPL